MPTLVFVCPLFGQTGGGEMPVDDVELWSRYRPRLSFHHQVGESIGLSDSLTSLHAFVPFSGNASAFLTFVDVSGRFVDDGVLGGSIGIGSRFEHSNDLVFGSFVYYDYRTTDLNQFQQLSPGVEVLAEGWEFRANGYLPGVFGDRQRLPSEFRGSLLFTDRYETALTGFDLEAGVGLPLLEEFDVRLLAGTYHLQPPSGDGFWGWKQRLAATLSDAVSMSLSVQNDRVFDTTVNFGFEVRFSGGALLQQNPLNGVRDSFLTQTQRRSSARRMAASPVRLHTVALGDSEETLALDPATGLPLMFLHVAPGGNSDGSLEDPYATLADALMDPRFRDGSISTIFVRADGTQSPIHSEDFELREGARLISSGPTQMVSTHTGTHQLPITGLDTQLASLPVIEAQVTLKNNTELSGFEIRVTDDETAITANAVSQVIISNNDINVESGTGILLSGINSSDSTQIIQRNHITGMAVRTQFSPHLGSDPGPGSGDPGGGDPGSGDPGSGGGEAGAGGPGSGTTQTTLFGEAIRIENSPGIQAMITGNEMQILRNGIRLTGEPTNMTDFTGVISQNIVQRVGESALHQTNGSFSASVSNNTIDDSKFAIVLEEMDLIGGDISNNTVSGTLGQRPEAAELSRLFKVVRKNEKFVIEFNTDDVDDFDAIRLSLKEADLGGPGIPPVTPTGRIDIDIENNSVDGAFFRGISVTRGSAGQTADVTLDGNTVQNALVGIELLDGDQVASTASAFRGMVRQNTVTGGEIGVDVLGVGTFNGVFEKNTVEQNSLLGIQIRGNAFDADFIENTVMRNGGTLLITATERNEFGGIPLDIRGGIKFNNSGTVNSDFTRNRIDNNGGFGLSIRAGVLNSQFINNTTSNNSGRVSAGGGFVPTIHDVGVGFQLFADARSEAMLVVKNNESSGNSSHGYHLSNSFGPAALGSNTNLLFESNKVMNNGQEGVIIGVAGGESRIRKNTFRDNNVNDRPPELFGNAQVKFRDMTFFSNRPTLIELSGNTTNNPAPANSFNFVLRSGTDITLTPVDVRDVNTGTIGPADGNITIPAP